LVEKTFLLKRASLDRADCSSHEAGKIRASVIGRQSFSKVHFIDTAHQLTADTPPPSGQCLEKCASAKIKAGLGIPHQFNMP